jgi:hypothetical protein
MPKVFYGDDLMFMIHFLNGECSTNLKEVLITTCYDKFRPLPAAFNSIMMEYFKFDFWKYMAVNVVIHSFTATLFASMIWIIGKKGLSATIFLGIAFALSRFATFPIVVANGPFELLAIPILIGIIWCIYRCTLNQSDNWSFGIGALLLLCPLILTHERYLVVALWLFLIYMFLPNFRKLPFYQRYILILTSLSIPILFYIYKEIFLSSPFLVGTGGSSISFNLKMILGHMFEAILSIIGINEGPAYLIGIRSLELPWFPARFLSIVLIIILSVISFLMILQIYQDKKNNIKIHIKYQFPILLFSLAMLIIIPPVLTIRMEQRWLYVPFMLLLLTFAWLWGALEGVQKKIVIFLILIYSVCSVINDYIIMRHFNNTFYVSSSKFAEMVERDIARKFSEFSGKVYLIAGSDMCAWVLRNGDFFRIYSGEHREISCIDSGNYKSINIEKNIKIFSETKSGTLSDVTEKWKNKYNLRNSNIVYDFISNFKNGEINSTTFVNSPNKSGVFILKNSLTKFENAMIILPGFSYEFKDINLDHKSELRAEIGLIYPVKTSVKSIISIREINSKDHSTESTNNIELQTDLNGMKPTAISVPLESFSGKSISITFSIEIDGDSTAVWMAHFDPMIISLH